MFSKLFTKQILGLFAVMFVLAFAASAPIVFDNTSSFDDAVVSAWGGGDSDGHGGEGGDYGGDGCGGCGDDPGDSDPGDPPGAFILDCMDPAATNYNPGADGADNSLCEYAQSCDSFTASPTTIKEGEASLLKWQTSNATKVELKRPTATQVVAANGQAQVTPGKDYTFVLKVYGAGPTVTCEAPVKVTQPTPAPSCDSFTADPKSLPVGGGNTVLKWTTSNADSVTINQGIGGVNKNNTSGKTVFVDKTKTFVLTVSTAGHDDVTCIQKVTVKTATPAPSCDVFYASPSTIKAGEKSLLKWETSNATKVELKRPTATQVVAANGQAQVTPGKDYTFVLTVYGTTGHDPITCEAPVKIQKQSDPLTCAANLKTFTANPDNLPVGGGNTTLTWEAVGVDSISINKGVLSETTTLKGSDVVSVADDTTYTLTLKRGTETPVNCPISVVVEDKNPKPVSCAANAGFTASPTKLPYGGGDVELSWDTTRVKTVKLDGVVVAKTGTTSKSITTDTKFVLEITGNNNTTGNTEQCELTVEVDDPTPSGISCAANVTTWKANDYSIRRGSSVELEWKATGLDTIEINNGVLSETSDLDGAKTVSPSSDITYTLTGKKGSKTITCKIDIDVSSGGSSGSSNPRCDFDASKTSIAAGEEVTLSWDNRYVRDLTIFEGDEDDGTKIFETDDDDLVDEGSFRVRPTEDTTYTLLVERGSKDRTCDVDIKVKDDVVLTSTRNQGMVAGISLTAVPYTGFDAGPTLTFIFYALLAIWGLFVAYVIVIRKDSMAGASLPGAHPKHPVVNVDYSALGLSNDRETSEAAAYVGSVLSTPAAPTQAAPSNLPVEEAPVVGYAAASASVPAVDNEVEAELKELEDRAHEQQTLISSDAMREMIALCPRTVGRLVYLDMIIKEAKVTYPAEDGWVVLNHDRITDICHKRNSALAKEVAPVATTAAPVEAATTSGSLAEAIVTGNIAAAYQMIGNRPMIALADAAADLDALYRARKGEQVAVSDMIATESVRLSDTQIVEAIAALTSAIDGTYADEAGAVKMAILKATKALG